MNPNNYPPISSPQEIPERFTEAWNERNAKKLAALFDQDAEFVNVVGIWWHTREDIYKAHEYGLRVIFNNSTLKQGRTNVKYLSDDIAVVHARMILRNQTPLDDKTPETRQTIFSFVVHKSGDSWSCASAQNTDIVPGKETHIVRDAEFEAVDYRDSESR